MVSFVPKKIITKESIGEKLRAARQLKNIDIDTAAHRLNIRREYLLSLEMDDLESLPAGLYGKNFLKRYSQFLDINDSEINEYLAEISLEANSENPFSQKIIDRKKFIIFPKILRSLLISAAVLACFLYLILYFNNIVSAPKLEVRQPDKNLLIKESSILVIGSSEQEAEIKINGELALSNADGEFSKLVNLKKGLNTLEISAKKKYSRENIIIRQILVE